MDYLFFALGLDAPTSFSKFNSTCEDFCHRGRNKDALFVD